MSLAALLGLLVGSFLNVVIYRLPLMMEREWQAQSTGEPVAAAPFNLVTPRSACPTCKTPIKPWHNVPVISYLALQGQCPACRAPISARYPLIELATALLSALVVWHFGFTPEALAALCITWALIALSVIDFDHHLLPDAITLPLLWAGLLWHILVGDNPGSHVFASLRDGVIGAVAGYLSLWLVYHGFRLVTGKEGMGYGDFKLFAALGAWFGWQMLPLIILLSAFTGALLGIGLIVSGRQTRQQAMPFGPYLAAAGLVALLWGPQLLQAYLRAPAT